MTSYVFPRMAAYVFVLTSPVSDSISPHDTKQTFFSFSKDVSGGRHLLIDGSDTSDAKKPKQVVQSLENVEDEEGHVYL